jgi:hypothetical protein
MNATGDWDDATKWTSSNIGDAITENVTLSGNTSPTVRNGFSYTIGNLTAGGDNTITIDDTGSLTLGASGNSKSLTMTGNNPKLTIRGTLTIWGNVTFTNKVVWEVRGTVIIKGNLTLNGGANLDVKNGGLLRVEGDFIGGNNTDVTKNGGGTLQVVKNVNVGSGNLNGGGTFEYGGTCASGNPSFCGNAVHNTNLPIELLFLKANIINDGIQLNWATATEKNFDRFIIEHSLNGEDFQAVGEQPGQGNSVVKNYYAFIDSNPGVGKNYYRLKSVDFDLAYEYSTIVFAEYDGDKSISLYPNPVTGNTINIIANFETQPGGKIEIMDYLGTKLQEIFLSDTSQKLNVENDLDPGMYILRYTGSNYTKLIRFTKK